MNGNDNAPTQSAVAQIANLRAQIDALINTTDIEQCASAVDHLAKAVYELYRAEREAKWWASNRE